MMKLLLIRHGETEFNAQRRFTGISDIKLSRNGTEQVKAVALRLRQEPLAALYSSTLPRALQTAAMIAELNPIAIQGCDGLREIDFGHWEGLTYEEIQARYPEVAAAWVEDPIGITIPGGEPWSHFRNRIVQTISSIVEHESKENNDGTVVVVAHGGPIQMMVRFLTLEDGSESRSLFDSFWPAPASITSLKMTLTGFEVITLNEIAYLW